MSLHHERARATVRGAVHGVGFGQFAQRLAGELALDGWVESRPHGVVIEVEGVAGSLREFLVRLEREKPAKAVIQGLEFTFLDPVGHSAFAICGGDETKAVGAHVSPDTAPCPQCLHELFQPGNRRFRYPFISCALCGPRFSITEDGPGDREHTTMKKFLLCGLCEREYSDPSDRRFRAPAQACPRCGPQLELCDSAGNVLARQEDALHHAGVDIQSGKIVAIKTVGGFHLLADARVETVVGLLRQRLRRPEQAFALIYPSIDLVRRDCHLSQLEERLLLSREAPAVRLNRWTPALAPSIAPGQPTFDVMLPATPLHYLLMQQLGFPVVCASGSVADEPVSHQDSVAPGQLEGVADYFLMHNQRIARTVDDSIVRVVRGREMMVRRSRGYAPLPVPLPSDGGPVLAVGADVDNSLALSSGRQGFLSQHLGDLQTAGAHSAFLTATTEFPRLTAASPEMIACELQSGSLSRQGAARLASKKGWVLHPVPHHQAHLLSCMVENEVPYPALGVVWDEGALGPDGTIWGGEFLLARETEVERVAHLRGFALPGREPFPCEPRRAAAGLLFAWGGSKALSPDLAAVRDLGEKKVAAMVASLKAGESSAITSSAGHFFAAVASLIGLRHSSTYAGQAAAELEYAVHSCVSEAYAFEIKSTAPSLVDWYPTISEIVEDIGCGHALGIISAKFHNTLVEIIVAVARHVGETRVVLSGECFQNRYLTERTVQRLIESGFRPYWHQRVPTNDGGIALGQLVAVGRRHPQPAPETATQTTRLDLVTFAEK